MKINWVVVSSSPIYSTRQLLPEGTRLNLWEYDCPGLVRYFIFKSDNYFLSPSSSILLDTCYWIFSLVSYISFIWRFSFCWLTFAFRYLCWFSRLPILYYNLFFYFWSMEFSYLRVDISLINSSFNYLAFLADLDEDILFYSAESLCKCRID